MRDAMRQIMRFCGVGVGCFLLDYAILMFLTFVMGMDGAISAAISFTLATLVNYALSIRFVFDLGLQSKPADVPPDAADSGRLLILPIPETDEARARRDKGANLLAFILIALIGLLMNEIGMSVGLAILPTTPAMVTILKCIVGAMVSIWSFWSRKQWYEGNAKQVLTTRINIRTEAIHTRMRRRRGDGSTGEMGHAHLDAHGTQSPQRRPSGQTRW